MPMIDRYVIERASERAASGGAVYVNLSATTIGQEGLFDDIIGAFIATERRRADHVRDHRDGRRRRPDGGEPPCDAACGARLPDRAGRLRERLGRLSLPEGAAGQHHQDRPRVRPRHIDADARALSRWSAARSCGPRSPPRPSTRSRRASRTSPLFIRRSSLGVDYAQGFYLGAPRPVDTAIGLAARRRLEDCGGASRRRLTRKPRPSVCVWTGRSHEAAEYRAHVKAVADPRAHPRVPARGRLGPAHARRARRLPLSGQGARCR